MTIVRAAGGVPGLTLYTNGNGGDPARRVIIRETSTTPYGTEWSPLQADQNEREGPRGLVLARELSGGGRLRVQASGFLLLGAVSAGVVRLRIRACDANANPSPIVAIASTSVLLQHDVSMAQTGSGSTTGTWTWEAEIIPQYWESGTVQVYSKFVYQRWNTENLIADQYEGGHIASMNMRVDNMVMPSMQKILLGSPSTADFTANGYVCINSYDAWIDNGRSGQA